ncbi:MAG: sodium:solute symporter [Acidobacteria bacterium]|nr:sodium:solute symporter [Acidobacteriota bacterium]
MTIHPLDLAIVLLYLTAVVAAGYLSSRHASKSSSEYFLAGRSLGWVMIGSALFASNISTIHLVGLAASGYNEGLVWGNFEWMATLTLILLSLVFAPFYYRSRIATLPEFLERRYCSGARGMLAFMGIIGALFIHIGMSLYAGAVVFDQFFGIDVVTSIVLVSFVTSIYTVAGGLRAVVVTEAIQTVLLLAGAVIVTVLAVLALPSHGIHSIADLRLAVKPDQLSMLRTDNSVGLAWYSVLLGYPVLGIWYWCTDQTIVQRVLGAKTERDAQLGPLFAGLLKILPVFLMVLPGVLGYVLFRDLIGSNSNQTLPVLILQLVPVGLRGLICAGVLAALMSTIASALNSCGTLVAVDIARRLRPDIDDRTEVRIGRLSAVVVMLLAMVWSTQGGRYTSIFEAINAIAADLAPPITTVFLWGVFWKRGTWQAAMATLICGFLLGAAAFLADLPIVGNHKLITEGWGIPFMLQAWWLFCICSSIYFVTSLCTPAPAAEQIAGLTWSNPLHSLKPKQARLADPSVLALLLAIFLALLYIWFC